MSITTVKQKNPAQIEQELSEIGQLQKRGLLPEAYQRIRSLQAECETEQVRLDSSINLTAVDTHHAPDELNQRVSRVYESIVSESIAKTSSNDQPEFLRTLLSDETAFNQERFNKALEAATYSSRTESLRILLSSERFISDEALIGCLDVSILNGYNETTQLLLSKIGTIPEQQLISWVSLATFENNYRALEYLLSNNRTISSEELGHNIWSASTYGYSDCIRILLSGQRTINQETLDRAIDLATSASRLDTLRTLLDDNRTISNSQVRNGALLLAASNGDADLTEAILRSGPIHSFTRDSAITQVDGDQRDRIIDMLNMAQIDDESIDPAIDGMKLTLSDVKEKPRFYLDLLSKNFPHKINLIDQPKTVDLGGVTKDYITTLFTALIKQEITLGQTQLPMMAEDDDDSKLLYIAIGGALSKIDDRNETRADKFLIGSIFNPKFYELLKLVEAHKTNEASYQEDFLKKCAALIKEIDPATEIVMDLIVDSNQATISAYKAAMMDEDKDDQTVLTEAKDQLLRYVRPALYIFQGASDSLKNKIKTQDAGNLSESFQGKEASAKDLINAIKIESETALLKKQIGWIKEKIDSSDLAWRKAFLKAITGRECFLAGSKIAFKPTWRENEQTPLIFELHTCFNSLDLPKNDSTQEQFLEELNATIRCDSYSIA